MQDRPVVTVFYCIIRAVVTSPPLDTQQEATLIEILLEVLFAGQRVFAQQCTFHQRPARRGHGSLNRDDCLVRFQGRQEGEANYRKARQCRIFHGVLPV